MAHPDTPATILDLKFSPSGDLLAGATVQGRVDLYAVSEHYAFSRSCKTKVPRVERRTYRLSLLCARVRMQVGVIWGSVGGPVFFASGDVRGITETSRVYS